MDRKPNDPDELLAPAKANGYGRGEHRDQDEVPDRHAYVGKIIYDQDGALRRYVTYKEPSFLIYKWAPVPTRSSATVVVGLMSFLSQLPMGPPL